MLLKNENLLHPDFSNNPYNVEILEQLENMPGKAWLGLSWKGYLYTFAEMEAQLDNNEISKLLVGAEENWLSLEENDILMEEPRNNGSWIRPWRIAIASFNRYFK